MTRLICMLLTLALILPLLSGCTGDPPEAGKPSTAPSVSDTASTTAPIEPPETLDPALEELRNNLPIMDGSTSLIPLEAGIRAALFGISIEEATKDVAHTTSWDSFYNLLDGTVDLIFSVPLSEEQQAIADEQGIGLTLIPIAREGFVFVVNADNPVDALTQDQIRDIYSGKITNWSEVGGLDEEIIPYQRNRDSGSQNYMFAFMGDSPLMDAPSELRPASMSGLMDVIAVNDNARAAIGYSVYAYAADMYGNGDEIKFIKVDGVAPSKQTFADKTYPLMGPNYAIYRVDEPEGSPAKQLVNWMLSKEGQLAIAEAGYITIADTGYVYTEDTIEKYEGVGRGAPAGAVPTSEYAVVGTACSYGGDPFAISGLAPIVATLPTGIRTYRIDCLTNKVLQQEINDWIDQQMHWAGLERNALLTRIKQLNGEDTEYSRYVFGMTFSYNQPQAMDAACIITAKNGFLSVAITLCYTDQAMLSYTRYEHTETATWDLIEGRRLAPEELFCEGVDIDQVLNTYLREKSQLRDVEFGDTPELLEDFVNLPLSGWHLTHDAIYIDAGGPTFATGHKFDLDDLPDGILVTEQLRDFTHCIESDEVQVIRQFRLSDRDTVYLYNQDSWVGYGLMDESVCPEAAAVNAYITNLLNTHYTEGAIRSYFASLGYDPHSVDMTWPDWHVVNWGGRYLYFSGHAPVCYDGNDVIRYPYEKWVLYDLQAQRHISWQDLLLPGWEQEVTLLSTHDGSPVEEPDYDSLTLNSMYTTSTGAFMCYFDEDCYLEIPWQLLRFE